MRLWSIHPKYLDTVGLVALWRESLLAQKVLKGNIKGYKNHPQLKRFKLHPYPLRAIGNYLREIWEESRRRGYDFDKTKIGTKGRTQKIPVTSGQLRCEFEWLCKKLKRRNPERCQELRWVKEIVPHPLFKVTEGKIDEGEKTKEQKVGKTI